MIVMQELLSRAVEQQIFRHLDMQFAMMVADNDEPSLMLAAALLSRDTGYGHVCLPLTKLVADNKMPVLLQACFSLVGLVDWPQTLLSSVAVSEGDAPTPMILKSGRLYLNRMWYNGITVARFFKESNQSVPYDKELLSRTLNEIFGIEELINWQKVAAAVALTRRISVISGGPGTGKTTIVAKLLAAFIQTNNEQKQRIFLVAPTGKAAARLNESLDIAMRCVPFIGKQRKHFPNKVVTIHRLLGLQPGSQHIRYNKYNPLNLDVIVIDEASMIDLIMMAHLINALPSHARVIFLGDHNQLTSVEAGTVLSDICTYTNEGYTIDRAHELTQLTNCPIDGNTNPVAGTLRDSLCLLRKNYRFSNDSGISNLALAINKGNCQAIKTIFNRNFGDIRKRTIKTNRDYTLMLDEVLEGYLNFLNCVHKQNNPEKILAAFSEFQLLCILRDGPFGATELNKNLEQILLKTQNISYRSNTSWYEGRPIMILRNDSTLGLFNGDIGIALVLEHKLRVWFRLSDGGLKSFQPSCLPEHETVWAMMAHKSQGSEFDQVMLVLPMQTTPLLSRELIYTAVTRARKFLSLYTDDCVLMSAIMTNTERRSGLNLIFNSI